VTFPSHRGRRLRRTEGLRALARETRIAAEQLVAPLFVHAADRDRVPIAAMAGHARLSPEAAAEEAEALAALGVGSVILFGIPARKDAEGSGAWAGDGPVPRAVRLIKKRAPALVVWADVCLCEYTDHGHCGVLRGGDVDNDATLPLLTRAAVAYAQAGADVVAPSDMMDGRVAAIRAGSTPGHGDRRGYQMDAANVREAIDEALADVDEGADALIVKPGMPCLDVLRAVREAVRVPVASYQVSGEYAMIQDAAERGHLDLERAMWESTLGMRRAGADLVITYFARALAERLQSSRGAAEAARWT